MLRYLSEPCAGANTQCLYYPFLNAEQPVQPGDTITSPQDTFLSYCRVGGKSIRSCILGTECLWYEKFQREPNLKLFKNGLFLEDVCAVHSPEHDSNIQCVVWNVLSVSRLYLLGYMLVVIFCNLSQISVVQLLTGKWPFLPALCSSAVTALTLQNKGD